jgi:hypothetical protein
MSCKFRTLNLSYKPARMFVSLKRRNKLHKMKFILENRMLIHLRKKKMRKKTIKTYLEQRERKEGERKKNQMFRQKSTLKLKNITLY